jgi:hypothetical protein
MLEVEVDGDEMVWASGVAHLRQKYKLAQEAMLLADITELVTHIANGSISCLQELIGASPFSLKHEPIGETPTSDIRTNGRATKPFRQGIWKYEH